ncbi:MAG: glycosyltransferase [Sporolactobacillus sp.]
MRAVVVLYCCDLEQSETLVSLQQLSGQSKSKIALEIYDNSPNEIKDDVTRRFAEFKSVLYIHRADNPGIAVAYNDALERSVADGEKWLLLLDQDSTLTERLIDNYFKTIAQVSDNGDVVAVLPDVVTLHGTLIVPVKVSSFWGRYSLFLSKDQIVDSEVRTINSGSLLRVTFLNEINGFNEEFHLDCLDHWIFRMIFIRHKRVFLTHDNLIHDLSISNMKNYVTSTRYKDILRKERLFYTKYTNLPCYINYKFELCKRLKRQIRHVKDKKISWMTFIALFK